MMHLTRNQKKGLHAERWAFDQLSKRFKYDVTMPADFSEPCCDLVLDGRICVEVKWSAEHVRQRKLKSGWTEYPKWVWNLSNIGDTEGVLILIAEDVAHKIHPFIIPLSLMHNKTTFEINTHPEQYRGFIAPFLNCWDTVPFIVNADYHDPNQAKLFEMSLTGEIEYTAVKNA